MTSPGRFMARTAYCSASLCYPETIRQISTNEFVPCPNIGPVEQVQKTLDAGIKAWKASKEFRRLRSGLETTMLPKITKIIAFGNSTMAASNDIAHSSSQQHALMLTVRDIVDRRRTAGQPKLKCFAQDPMYSEADKQVIRKLGITVLGDPRAFLEVDDGTVVLSFYPNFPVRQIIADIARPAVMIWRRIRPDVEDRAVWKERYPYEDPGETDCELQVTNASMLPVRLCRFFASG